MPPGSVAMFAEGFSKIQKFTRGADPPNLSWQGESPPTPF